MTIQWLDSYQVGDAELDAQHRELFAAGNRFAVAKCRDSRLLFSIAMFRHAREHFEFEENLMRRVKYPAIADHFKEHTDLISILTTFSDRVASDALQSVEVEAFLRDWLVNHMATADARLAVYLGSLLKGKGELVHWGITRALAAGTPLANDRIARFASNEARANGSQ